MTQETFNQLVDELEETRSKTLKEKNAKYAPHDDALHNFHAGAEIMGVPTTQCMWGYMTKHLVALRDKILDNNWDDLEDVKEKCQDIQNYITFIWCAAHEENNLYNELNNIANEAIEGYKDCSICKHFDLGDEDGNCDTDGTVIVEPCASCKNNFCPSDKKYDTSPLNWELDENRVSAINEYRY